MTACTEHGVVYLAAIGGLGALLAKQISAARVVAYPDLGPEALFELELTAFPAVVIIDRNGQNLHDSARWQWRTEPGTLNQEPRARSPEPRARARARARPKNHRSGIPSPWVVIGRPDKTRKCRECGQFRELTASV